MVHRVFMSKVNGELVVGKPIMILEDNIQVYQKEHIVPCLGYALFHEDECVLIGTNNQLSYLPLEDLGEL